MAEWFEHMNFTDDSKKVNWGVKMSEDTSLIGTRSRWCSRILAIYAPFPIFLDIVRNVKMSELSGGVIIASVVEQAPYTSNSEDNINDVEASQVPHNWKNNIGARPAEHLVPA